MASNSFGQVFRITTWGESHGPAIGVVIDGCPAGLPLSIELIQEALDARAPGRQLGTSPRKELDELHIYSGLFEGKTTGTPISIVIYNHDADSSKYEAMKHVLKPGHAQFTYLQKYGVYDYCGGGRASARETACRVAAAAIAKQLFRHTELTVEAYLTQVGDLCRATVGAENFAQQLEKLLTDLQNTGDSLGGVVEFQIKNLPAGWGDPVYEKIEAKLGQAMMSIPASKGFEIGQGFASVACFGSAYNDLFVMQNDQIQTLTNHSGGCLGGITTGMPIYGRVAFKPTSSIRGVQASLTTTGQGDYFELAVGSRHDPCVAIRAVPVVQAMCYLVCADVMLMSRLSKF